LIIYVDGTAETENTTTTINNFRTGVPLRFARPENQLWGTFAGKQTETSIFSRELSSTEINDIMDNGLVGTAGGAVRRFFLVS